MTRSKAKHATPAPRREDPGLSWCRHCFGVVIPSATGALMTSMGELHACQKTRAQLAAIGAAWVVHPDGSREFVWLASGEEQAA